MDGGVGYHSTGGAEGARAPRARAISSHDMNGGSYRKKNEVVKG